MEDNQTKKQRLAISMAAILAIAFAIPVFAHHSIASEFDASKVTTISGVMLRMEWINPHARIYLNVKDDNGAIATWVVETSSVNGLMKAGLNKSMIDLTKTYSIEIWPAIDGSKRATGRTLTFSDGRTFDVSDKFPQSPITK